MRGSILRGDLAKILSETVDLLRPFQTNLTDGRDGPMESGLSADVRGEGDLFTLSSPEVARAAMVRISQEVIGEVASSRLIRKTQTLASSRFGGARRYPGKAHGAFSSRDTERVFLFFDCLNLA